VATRGVGNSPEQQDAVNQQNAANAAGIYDLGAAGQHGLENATNAANAAKTDYTVLANNVVGNKNAQDNATLAKLSEDQKAALASGTKNINDVLSGYASGMTANQQHWSDLSNSVQTQLAGSNAQRMADINSAYGAQGATIGGQMSAQGLGGTTIAPTMQAGNTMQNQQEQDRQNQSFQQLAAGYKSDIGKAQFSTEADQQKTMAGMGMQGNEFLTGKGLESVDLLGQLGMGSHAGSASLASNIGMAGLGTANTDMMHGVDLGFQGQTSQGHGLLSMGIPMPAGQATTQYPGNAGGVNPGGGMDAGQGGGTGQGGGSPQSARPNTTGGYRRPGSTGPQTSPFDVNNPYGPAAIDPETGAPITTGSLGSGTGQGPNEGTGEGDGQDGAQAMNDPYNSDIPGGGDLNYDYGGGEEADYRSLQNRSLARGRALGAYRR
jgi:hypothetical protein